MSIPDNLSYISSPQLAQSHNVLQKLDTAVLEPHPPLGPALPPYEDAFKSVPLLGTSNEKGTFEEFLKFKRTFVGKINPDQRDKISRLLQRDPYYLVFMDEKVMDRDFGGDITIESSYAAFIDMISQALKSKDPAIEPRMRGGYLRFLLQSWFEECYAAVHPNSKKIDRTPSDEVPPDIDIVFLAPNLSMEQIQDVENEIFKHFARILSSHNPALYNCYFTFAAICCWAHRDTPDQYTLTTLQSQDSPNLEIIIAKKFSRSTLCRLDGLSVSLVNQKLHCNSGDTSDEAIFGIALDNVNYALTVEDPESVDGMGLARLVSHTVKSGTFQGVDTFRRIYNANRSRSTTARENFVTSLIERFYKCNRNHFSGNPKILAAMFWNLYALSGFEEPQFHERACATRCGLEFQSLPSLVDLQKWATKELCNSSSAVKIEWVKNDDRQWIRVCQDEIYWLIPSFTLQDGDLIDLLQHAREKVPEELLRQNFSDIASLVHPLPLALIQQEKVKWHSAAVQQLQKFTGEPKRLMAEKMVRHGHLRALPTLISIYKKLKPEASLFFNLVEKARQLNLNQNVSLQVDDLCELVELLPHAKRKKKEEAGEMSACNWLIEKCSTHEKALKLYRSFVDKGYLTENPSRLFARMDFNSMHALELIEDPIFRMLDAQSRAGHLRRAIPTDPFHAPDYLLHRAIKDGLINIETARSLFGEWIPLFSFTILDWAMELFPAGAMPLELYQRLPQTAQHGLACRVSLESLHFLHLVQNHRGTALSLHETLVINSAKVDEHLAAIFSELLALTLLLIKHNRNQETKVWMPRLLKYVDKISESNRRLLFKWCLNQNMGIWAMELAMTFKSNTAENVAQLCRYSSVPLESKCALLNATATQDLNVWKKVAAQHGSDPEMANHLLGAIKSRLLRRGQGSALLIPALETNLNALSSNPKSSEHIFRTCISIMTEFPEKITRLHKEALQAHVGAFFQTSANATEADECYNIFQSDPDLLSAFIQALAATKYSSDVHAKALEFLLKNEGQNFYASAAYRMIGYATLWQFYDRHEKELVQLATSVTARLNAHGCESNPNLVEAVKLLLNIRVLKLNTAIYAFLKDFSPTSRVDIEAWVSIAECWVSNRIESMAIERFDAETVVFFSTLLRSSNFEHPALHRPKIKIAKRLCLLAKQLHKSAAPNISWPMATLAMDFLHVSQFAFHQNPADHEEVAPIANEVLSHLLAPGEPFGIFFHYFKRYWAPFLTINIIPGVPSWNAVFDSEQSADFNLAKMNRDKIKRTPFYKLPPTPSGKYVIVTSECKERRLKEAKLKADLLFRIMERFIVEGLEYDEVLAYFDGMIDDFIKEFPEQNKVIMSVLHAFVFTLTPSSEPNFAYLLSRHEAGFIHRISRTINMTEAPLECFEMVFHRGGGFVNCFSIDKQVTAAKEVVLRGIYTRHPAHVYNSLKIAPDLKGYMTRKGYLDFLNTVYTATGVALAHIKTPYYYPDEILIESIFKLFTETPLFRDAGDLRTNVIIWLIGGAVTHMGNCTQDVAYPHMLLCIIDFINKCCTKDANWHLLNNAFQYHLHIAEMVSKNPVETDLLTKFLGKLNVPKEVILPQKAKGLRIEALKVILNMLPADAEGNKARQVVRKLTTQAWNWFADIPDAEALIESLFATRVPSACGVSSFKPAKYLPFNKEMKTVTASSLPASSGIIPTGVYKDMPVGFVSFLTGMPLEIAQFLTISEMIIPEDCLSSQSSDALVQSDSAYGGTPSAATQEHLALPAAPSAVQSDQTQPNS